MFVTDSLIYIYWIKNKDKKKKILKKCRKLALDLKNKFLLNLRILHLKCGKGIFSAASCGFHFL